jgi:phosphatidylglycerophosphatase A
MPGTLASLFCAAAAYFFARSTAIPLILDIGILLVLVLLGLLCARHLVRERGIKDPVWFVLDEISGMWLALLGLPKNNIPVLLTAFVLFRIFDIFKPWIIRRVDEMENAGSIILDDLLAAVPAWVGAFLLSVLL